VIKTCDPAAKIIPLGPRSVADFYKEIMAALRALNIDVKIWHMPVETPNPIGFDQDTVHASYDREYARRFWRTLVSIDDVFKVFRSRFVGKSSPVHFFWGSFDLAVTRFSGRPAPANPSADSITREGYSHEVSSCGFWPGDRRFPHASFYSYAAPAPERLAAEPVHPGGWDTQLSEFILKYDDVRASESPATAILDFCQTTYEAAAKLAHWDRAGLER